MTMSETNNEKNLEEEALKRRQRLLALKRKREHKSETAESNSKVPVEEVLPAPLFRSYRPVDDRLQENVLPNEKPEDVSSQVKDQLESAKSAIVIDQLDVTSLAPRKPDWDLKRDIAKKLEKLERQTQRAIAELIRERLRERKDLAEIANAESSDKS
ncbi:coiled-coil domain-containing protein 12 [Cylas formicarius]|uniref:coiled-coil domain-containing protein 12 n=1 Tax=Cylas formicarius TaxID=197179 RepID=UPI002958D543|nr:coiled-coil domain-containing protein 12 [Cylas formicarius]